MDHFVGWNKRLLETFFPPAGGEEVWLAINPEELDAIGPDLGGEEGLLAAVRQGPPWPLRPRYSWGAGQRAGFTALEEMADALATQRNNADSRPSTYVDPGSVSEAYVNRTAPTYLPILAALIHAASVQGEDGYYHSLRQALGLSANWQTSQMTRVEKLWHDLQRWTEESDGYFGHFNVRQLGGLRRVGIPRSQSVMSRRDCKMLTRVFSQLGLRPGQTLTVQLKRDVFEAARVSPFLSLPFRTALEDPAFATTVGTRLLALFEDWDGSVPLQRDANRGADNNLDTAEEIGLALRLGSGNSLPWCVGWQVPAVSDTGTVELTFENGRWNATLAGTEPVSTQATISRVANELAVVLLGRSEKESIEFSTTLLREESKFATRPLILRRRILRSLVASREADSVTLVERILPSFGSAYLLAAHSNSQRLLDYLSRSAVTYAICPTAGLPEGWLLCHISDCSEIQPEQRRVLPDGEDDNSRSQPRVIQFVGGRALSRAGLRQYLSYDLPSIELDAPPGTILEGAGLVLRETRSDISTPRPDERDGTISLSRSSLRRFTISLTGSESRLYAIEARRDGELLDQVRLRLASGEGLETRTGDKFSLDSLGDTLQGTEGLVGALIGSTPFVLPAQ